MVFKGAARLCPSTCGDEEPEAARAAAQTPQAPLTTDMTMKSHSLRVRSSGGVVRTKLKKKKKQANWSGLRTTH